MPGTPPGELRIRSRCQRVQEVWSSSVEEPENEIYEAFMTDLQGLARKCHTEDLIAEEFLICDAFASGLQSSTIRQRLLESSVDSLDDKTALTIKDARKLN